MPTPDEELDGLLAEDNLPVVPVPPIPNMSTGPGAEDKELDALLANDEIRAAGTAPGARPRPTAEQANSEEFPAEGGRVIEMPVTDIQGGPQPDATGEATQRGLGAPVEPKWFEKLGIRQARNANDYMNSVVPPERAAAATRHLESLASVPGVAKNFAATTAANAAGAPTNIAGTAALGAASGSTTRAADDPNATTGDVAGSGLVGGLFGGGMHAGMQGLQGLSKTAKDAANEYLTHIFMTGPQRAGYKAVKGTDSLSKLGADAEAAGLFKPRGVLDYLLPRNARRVAENAETKIATAGPAIGKFEDDFVKNSTAEVPIGDIADELRSKAKAGRELWDTANVADANEMDTLASRIDKPSVEQLEGLATQYPALRVAPPPKPMPPLPPKPALEGEQLTFVPDRTPGPPMVRTPAVQQQLPLQETPEQMVMDLAPGAQTEMSFAAGRIPRKEPALPKQQTFAQNQPFDSAAWKGPRPSAEQLPPPAEQLGFGAQQMSLTGVPPRPGIKPEPWAPGQGPGGEQTSLGVEDFTQTPLEATAAIRRESVPLGEAVANKRDIGNRIDWSKKRGDQTTYGQEAARKYTWGELRDRITRSLQDEVGQGKIPASAMAEYEKNMKDFSTAATAFDPALKMAERQNQTGLGLGDLMAGAAVGGGPVGGLAALTSRASRGMGPATAARSANVLSGASETVAGMAGVGARLSPIEQAQQENPGAPKHEVVDNANSNLKRQWYDIFRLGR